MKQFNNSNFGKWIVIFFFTILLFPNVGKASELEYSVQPVLPENQNKTTRDYFDLTMAPNQQQVLEIKIVNSSEKKIFITPQILVGATNSNGIVEYQKTTTHLNETLPVSLLEIAKIEKQVEIDKKSEKTIPIQLKMPNKQFDGEILGGIKIQEMQNKGSKNSGSIKNIYSYLLPLKIRQNTAPVKERIEYKAIKIDQDGSQNTLVMSFSNMSSTIMRKGRLKALIKKKGSKKVKYELEKNELTFAPNSDFNLNLSLKDEPFVPGEYEVYLKYQNNVLEKEWQDEVNITRNEAREFNKTSFVKSNSSQIIILLLVIIIILTSLLIYTYFKKIKGDNNA